MSDCSSPGFFSKGMTPPSFSADGKTSLLKDMFASLVMSGAMTSTVDVSMAVGMKLTGDDLAGMERIRFTTSSTVTSDSSSNKHDVCCLTLAPLTDVS